MEIVKRRTKLTHFKFLPRRWVVERTFAWLGRSRRLSKDYEHSVESSESFIYLAMIRLMRSLARRIRGNPPDDKKESAVAFLEAAVASYARFGVGVQRVMTDNGSCYKSAAFRKACHKLGLRHLRTRPYTPKTNGKAERFIQSSLGEWAYAQTYAHPDQPTAQLQRWLHQYNWQRPHRSLNRLPPISRLNLGDNVLTTHI